MTEFIHNHIVIYGVSCFVAGAIIGACGFVFAVLCSSYFGDDDAY